MLLKHCIVLFPLNKGCALLDFFFIFFFYTGQEEEKREKKKHNKEWTYNLCGP